MLLVILSRGKLMLRGASSALIHQSLKLLFSSNSSSAGFHVNSRCGIEMEAVHY